VGKRIPVELGSFSWPSKKGAEAAFRAILYDPRYAVHDPISDPVHDRMLRELVERHPQASEKLGDGIDHFYIGRTIDGDLQTVSSNATGIWIRRPNGDVEDFSYITAIRSHTTRSRVKEGLRNAVADRRLDYRDGRFASGAGVVSDMSGIPLSSRSHAHVVYLEPAWEQLAFRFAQSEGGWDAIDIHSGAGGVQIGSQLLDPGVESRWLDFFDAYAVLSLATASEPARRPRAEETAWAP
jgi:hypothetical protein